MIRSSARKMSCVANNCLWASYCVNFFLILEMPMTRVILAERAEGKAGEATMSLYVLWGSAVMRQMVVEEEVLRGWGMEILAGLRRLASVMCFLVVTLSQTAVVEFSSSSLSSIRLCFPNFESSFSKVFLFICFRRAFEAFDIYILISIGVWVRKS